MNVKDVLTKVAGTIDPKLAAKLLRAAATILETDEGSTLLQDIASGKDAPVLEALAAADPIAFAQLTAFGMSLFT